VQEFSEVSAVAPRQRVVLCGVGLDPITEPQLLEYVAAEHAAGRGGRIVTPNIDILRLASRAGEAREHIAAATVAVADGTPLIWASKLAGQPLPARVPGSDLIWSLAATFGAAGKSVFLLGGEPGVAEKAADVFSQRHPDLKIAGYLSPNWGFDTRPDEYAEVCAAVVDTQPDLVFVGLGFPKQERVIARLQPQLPQAWFMGCGAAIGFVAGAHPRAPRWMQRTGLEWVHRLGREPHRLVKRYLVQGVPFAARLLVTSAAGRFTSVPGPRAGDTG
jgi:N-acetylglucosaminyldiphosphoundecaprenol N-acetyl-beta-D-mannosaminyltransferase